MALLWWASLPREDVSEAFEGGAVAALPIGSLEQHGQHLPTNTDVRLAEAVTTTAAKRTRSVVVIAPTLPYGISEYHAGFGGTMWLSAITFAAVIADICTSVRTAGARALVLVNGHGGNTGALQTAATAHSSVEFSVIAVTYWDLIPQHAREVFQDDEGSIGHAGQAETSMMLATHPALVGEMPDIHEPIRPQFGPTIIDRLGATGVMGNPAAGRPELGARFLDQAADALASVFDSLA